jgi:hypothetical protein
MNLILSLSFTTIFLTALVLSLGSWSVLLSEEPWHLDLEHNSALLTRGGGATTPHTAYGSSATADTHHNRAREAAAHIRLVLNSFGESSAALLLWMRLLYRFAALCLLGCCAFMFLVLFAAWRNHALVFGTHVVSVLLLLLLQVHFGGVVVLGTTTSLHYRIAVGVFFAHLLSALVWVVARFTGHTPPSASSDVGHNSTAPSSLHARRRSKAAPA